VKKQCQEGLVLEVSACSMSSAYCQRSSGWGSQGRTFGLRSRIISISSFFYGNCQKRSTALKAKSLNSSRAMSGIKALPDRPVVGLPPLRFGVAFTHG
jgi:hypothetical protein